MEGGDVVKGGSSMKKSSTQRKAAEIGSSIFSMIKGKEYKGNS